MEAPTEADIWARMAQMCKGPYRTSVRHGYPKDTSVDGVWVAEGESRSGLCVLVSWVVREMEPSVGDLDYVLMVMTRKIARYGEVNRCANDYYWPHTYAGWGHRRQFCLEQERICRGQPSAG